jgi:hypothetical protein
VKCDLSLFLHVRRNLTRASEEGGGGHEGKSSISSLYTISGINFVRSINENSLNAALILLSVE